MTSSSTASSSTSSSPRSFRSRPLPPPRNPKRSLSNQWAPQFDLLKELGDSRFQDFPNSKRDMDAEIVYTQFAPPPPPKTSPRFNAQDAEITVVSSDNILFRLHRMNVRVTAGSLLSRSRPSGGAGFGVGMGAGEEVDYVVVSEPADVLEILFEFLYPNYETNLEKLDFDTLLGVAEAAEKYGVFYAMSHCAFCLRQHTMFHAPELIRFAVTFRKEKLMEELSPALIDMELEEVMNILPVAAFADFCIFRDKWVRALIQSSSLILEITCSEHEDDRVETAQIQNLCSSSQPELRIGHVLKQFFDNAMEKPSLLFPENFDREMARLEGFVGGSGCVWCRNALVRFKEEMVNVISDGLPKTFHVRLY